MPGLESVPQHEEQVVSQRTDREAILLQLETGKYFSLDVVGSRIWDLCDGSRNVRAIVDAICDEYAADEETVAGDVGELLAELQRERLVRLR